MYSAPREGGKLLKGWRKGTKVQFQLIIEARVRSTKANLELELLMGGQARRRWVGSVLRGKMVVRSRM